MSAEVTYVGHLSHELLAQEDLAMPLNLIDKKSGVTYFQAARRMGGTGIRRNPHVRDQCEFSGSNRSLLAKPDRVA